MKEIKTSDFDTISQSNKISETFNPDKRIEVKERPVNGNFTESDKAAIEKGINLLGNDDFKESRTGNQWDDSEKGYLKPNYEYTAVYKTIWNCIIVSLNTYIQKILPHYQFSEKQDVFLFS